MYLLNDILTSRKTENTNKNNNFSYDHAVIILIFT